MAVYFERSTYSGAEPITLSEAKAFLRVDSSDDDSYITELITMARDFIEKETNTALVSNTYTEYRNGFPSKDNGVITLQINGDLTINNQAPQVAYLKDGVWTNLHDGTELIENGDFEEGEEELTDGGLDITTVSSYNTGNALSFDGVNDYVDFGSDVNSNGTVWTTAIWISNFTASSSLSVIYGRDNTRIIGLDKNGNVFFRVSTGTYYEFDCDVFNTSFTDAKRLVFTADGTDVKLYLDGVYIDKITPVNTELILRRLMAGYTTSAHLVDATVSDFQLYDTAWSAADVTYDYNNPQNLVTDNPNGTIALSNLKGYWHLSEGDGAINYDSSGEGNDGTINGATWEDQQATIPQLGLMDWAKSTPVADEVILIQDPNNTGFDILGNALTLIGSKNFNIPAGTITLTSGWVLNAGWSVEDDKAACDGNQTAESNIYQETVVGVGKTYVVTYTVTRSAGSVRVKVGSTGTGTYRDAAGTYTETITAAGDTTFYINADADFIGTVDTITVKEVDPNDYWTLGTGWTIGVDKVSQSGSTSYLSYDSFTPNIGTKYEVVYTVSEYTSGFTSIDFAGSSLVFTESSLGTFSYEITATTTDKFQIKSTDFVGAINSISIIPFTVDYFSSEFNGLPRVEPNGGWDVTPDDRLNSVKIIYTAGPPEAGVIAPPLKQAMYLLLAHYYDNRSAVSFGNPKELPLGYKRIINNYKNPIWS